MSAVLHLDESTPHIHATVVPIVRGERRKAKQEQAKNEGKRTYRKKKDAPRLCADDVMSRPKLKEYQTTYAEQMAKFGLQRGVDGSEAKHITCSQFYKEVFLQQGAITEKVEQLTEQKETLAVDIAALQIQQTSAQADYHTIDKQRRHKKDELQAAEKELAQTRREIKTDKLKGAAVDATTKAVERIGALFNDPKSARYEQQIAGLQNVITEKEQESNSLRSEIGAMQTAHAQEREQLKQDAASARQELVHVHELFPEVRGLMLWEGFCRNIGLTLDWIKALFTLKPLNYTGDLKSPEFERSFRAQDATLQFQRDKDGPGGFRFTIDGVDNGLWFRQQRNDQIKRLTGVDMQQRPRIKRGI